MHRHTTILTLLIFNSVTALLGGIGLMFDIVAPPRTWLDHTFFNSYLIPGLILFFIVGGSALFALQLQRRHSHLAPLATMLSGIIMLVWIVGEMITIRTVNWLQAIYLATGLMLATVKPAPWHIKHAEIEN